MNRAPEPKGLEAQSPDGAAVKYKVRHVTAYKYSQQVSLCQNQARLSPQIFARQSYDSARLTVQPEPLAVHSWRDYFGNTVHYFGVEVPHQELIVTAESVVSVGAAPVPSASATVPWEEARDAYFRAGIVDEAAVETAPFRYESPAIRFIPEAREYVQPSFGAGRPLLEGVLDLTARIWRDFKYDPAATCVNTETEELFRNRRGVCQDFAHLEITCLRSLGLAARYVSGYLLTDPPPGQPKLVGADASHAWVSVYIPQHGWVDFDPTNNTVPQLRHVTLAWGRDYSDVCPIKGIVLGGGDHQMTVSVDVSPVESSAKPPT